jgi:hypothetical protein
VLISNTTAIKTANFCTQCWKPKSDCMCGCTLVRWYPIEEENKFTLAIKHYLETGDIEPYHELVE